MSFFNLGISSYTFPFSCGTNKRIIPAKPFTPWDMVQKTQSFQVPVLQIADNLPLENLPKTELVQLGKYAEEQDIILETGFRRMDQDHLLQCIHVTKDVGSHFMRFVIDGPGFIPSLPEICEIISSVLPLLEKENITLGIENHDRFYSREFAWIIQSLHSPYGGIVLDTANSLSKEEPVEQVFDHLIPFLVSFHAKDYTICRRTGEMGFVITGAPAGKGRLNFPHIFSRLKREAPRPCSIILESWMESLPSVAETLDRENQWAAEGISYLKKCLSENE